MTETRQNPIEFCSSYPMLLDDPITHRVRWTVEAAMMLVKAGIIDEAGYELLDGELVKKVKHRPHINTLLFVIKWVMRTFTEDCYQFEAPVTVAEGEAKTNYPEPDVAVLRRPFSEFTNSNPTPDDVLLLIEVSDSTLDDDLNFKAGLYARAGYAEYWVMDIPRRRLHVHRNPVDGIYTVEIYNATEEVAPLTAPHARVLVETLLA